MSGGWAAILGNIKSYQDIPVGSSEDIVTTYKFLDKKTGDVVFFNDNDIEFLDSVRCGCNSINLGGTILEFDKMCIKQVN